MSANHKFRSGQIIIDIYTSVKREILHYVTKRDIYIIRNVETGKVSQENRYIMDTYNEVAPINYNDYWAKLNE